MKALFTENLSAKIIALVFALLLWAYVKGTDNASVSVSLPVVFTDKPTGISAVTETAFAEVRVEGPRTLLTSNLFRQSRIEVSVENDQIGQDNIAVLSSENVRMPFGLNIVSIKPSIVRYRLENLISIQANILPNVLGSPAEGYEIARLGLDPEKIALQVPESQADASRLVKTSPVDISGIEQSQDYSVSLQLPPSVNWEAREIRLHVELEETIGTRTYSQIPVQLNGPGEPSPAFVQIRLEGPARALDILNPFDLRAMADSSGRIQRIEGLDQTQRIRILGITPRQIDSIPADGATDDTNPRREQRTE